MDSPVPVARAHSRLLPGCRSPDWHRIAHLMPTVLGGHRHYASPASTRPTADALLEKDASLALVKTDGGTQRHIHD
jgi:hypothetical protein